MPRAFAGGARLVGTERNGATARQRHAYGMPHAIARTRFPRYAAASPHVAPRTAIREPAHRIAARVLDVLPGDVPAHDTGVGEPRHLALHVVPHGGRASVAWVIHEDALVVVRLAEALV